MHHITLCNKHGVALCGSDGHLCLDGRFGHRRVVEEVNKYKEGFRKNFPNKYTYWTHFYVGELTIVCDKHNKRRADPYSLHKIPTHCVPREPKWYTIHELIETLRRFRQNARVHIEHCHLNSMGLVVYDFFNLLEVDDVTIWIKPRMSDSLASKK